MRAGSTLMTAMVKTGAGTPEAAELLAELERASGHRVNAQRVHLVCHLMQANLSEAAVTQRRVELAMLQDGHLQRGAGTTARLELLAYALMDDLSGVKEVTERLAKATDTFPLWAPLVYLGQCHHRRLQGDLQGALDALQPALEQAKPLRNRDWNWIAAAHVQVLAATGRSEEAVERGLAYAEICERERLHPGSRLVAMATAGALISAKRADETTALLERLRNDAFAAGVRGLMLGSIYEHSARAAIARSDADAFRRNAEACAREYRADRTPMLAAKYERLVREAEAAGVIASAQLMQIVPQAAELTSGGSAPSPR